MVTWRRSDRLCAAAAALVGAALVAVGCGGNAGRADRSVIDRWPEAGDNYLVGMAEVDLTPPPGFAAGGYGPAGALFRGAWGRLNAQAMWCEDGAGGRLVVCSADLYAIHAGLVQDVLAAVNQGGGPGGRALAEHELVLAATHTHHGPGNFASTRIFNDKGTCVVGYDEQLRAFLAARIAHAIELAESSAQPATLESFTGDAPGVARLRSYPAFLRNPEAGGYASRLGPTGPLGTPMVMPIRVLSARASADGARIGALVFASSHPTALHNESEVYSADFFGVAREDLRRQLDCPVAILNGAEGDVSPAWDKRNIDDAVALGKRFAQHAREAITGPATRLQGPIVHSFSWEPMGDQTLERPDARTARTPAPGVATIGGAEDGRTFFYELGWIEGVRATAERLPGQGAKHPAMDLRIELPPGWRPRLTGLLFNPDHAPDQVPLGVHWIGPLVVGTLPGEFTVVMGARVRAALARQTGMDVELIGLANEYLSYFTTCEEYDAQHYEGASTMFGPLSAEFISERLAALAENPGAIERSQAPRDVHGPGRTLGFRMLGGEPTDVLSVLQSVFRPSDLIESAEVHGLLRSREWEEEVDLRRWQMGSLAMPLVEVTWDDGEGGRDVSVSYDIVVVCTGVKISNRTARCTFRTVWLGDPTLPGLLFTVTRLDGTPLAVDPE